MKRFYKEVAVAPEGAGWQVKLDGRGVKTQGGRPQVVPTQALAEALAAEWAAQGEEIAPASFVLRDLADYAIDIAGQDRASAEQSVIRFAESDTLCYRAEPGEALARRQDIEWEPLLSAAEARHGVRFERVSGIIHKPQPPETLAVLVGVVAAQDHFTLAALNTLASLAASLVIALAALEPDQDAEGLWAAANLEEDFQSELWGRDAEAEARRAQRLATFAAAMRFAGLVQA